MRLKLKTHVGSGGRKCGLGSLRFLDMKLLPADPLQPTSSEDSISSNHFGLKIGYFYLAWTTLHAGSKSTYPSSVPPRACSRGLGCGPAANRQLIDQREVEPS